MAWGDCLAFFAFVCFVLSAYLVGLASGTIWHAQLEQLYQQVFVRWFDRVFPEIYYAEPETRLEE